MLKKHTSACTYSFLRHCRWNGEVNVRSFSVIVYMSTSYKRVKKYIISIIMIISGLELHKLASMAKCTEMAVDLIEI